MSRAIALDSPVNVTVLPTSSSELPQGEEVAITNITVDGKLAKPDGFGRFYPVEGNFAFSRECKKKMNKMAKAKIGFDIFKDGTSKPASAVNH